MADHPATRQEALDDFERARAELKAAYTDVPDAALHFLPEGDDYALGGLIVHVANALENYVRVLTQMREVQFAAMKAPEGSGETAEMLEALKHGFGGEERAQHWARMDDAHNGLVAQVLALQDTDFTRTAPVTYGDASEPFHTSAAQIMTWMTDHYRDHIGQVADMLRSWQAQSA